MNATPLTLVGNLVDDPELRFTPSGAAVANFRVASTPRRFDRTANEWVDGEAMFLSCSVWREQAENVAESLKRGMRVVVYGKLKARSYETREGEKRTVFEVEVDEVAPSLKYARAEITRNSRGGGGGGSWGGERDAGNQGGRVGSRGDGADGGRGDGWGGQRSGRDTSQSSDDPWRTSGSRRGGANASDPWGTGGFGSDGDSEPPF